MTETATISGGKQVTLSLSQTQFQAAKSALDALSSHYSDSKVFTSTSGVPVSGYLNAFDIDAAANGSYTAPSGAQTVILYNQDSEAQASATLTGDSTPNQLLIGNNGNDTINVTGGSGSIIAGDGDNTINLASSSENVSAGTGRDTIAATGNDTITLGTGNDTLKATGSATVYGGSGSLYYDARAGVNSVVHAGSGSETLFGGSGVTDFYGSTTGGSDYMLGGSGKNFFEGGNGNDTMVASTRSDHNEIFDFASSVSGGTHVIEGFIFSTKSGVTDVVQLQGYTRSDVTNVTVTGGNTVITLDDHTSITLKGVTNFSESDIKFTH